MEKEEWKKFFDREIESLRTANINLMKQNAEVMYTV